MLKYVYHVCGQYVTHVCGHACCTNKCLRPTFVRCVHNYECMHARVFEGCTMCASNHACVSAFTHCVCVCLYPTSCLCPSSTSHNFFPNLALMRCTSFSAALVRAISAASLHGCARNQGIISVVPALGLIALHFILCSLPHPICQHRHLQNWMCKRSRNNQCSSGAWPYCAALHPLLPSTSNLPTPTPSKLDVQEIKEYQCSSGAWPYCAALHILCGSHARNLGSHARNLSQSAWVQWA